MRRRDFLNTAVIAAHGNRRYSPRADEASAGDLQDAG